MDLEDRFWSKVDIGDKESCWNWTSHMTKGGYGQVKINGANDGAHRVAYKLSNGDICDGLFVCHRCDNPACCNPGHLFLGTHDDNMRDKAKKGRVKGEKNPNATLTPDKVHQLRSDHSHGMSLVDLGLKYGISRIGAYLIATRRRWRHI